MLKSNTEKTGWGFEPNWPSAKNNDGVPGPTRPALIGIADQFLYSENEMEKIKRFVRDYKDNIDSNYAGHLHINWYVPVWSELFVPLYHVRVTDETWSGIQWPESEDHGVTVRWVQVDNSGLKISYHQNIENISKEASIEK